jgi:ABC-type lipoprotein release transport system permease subunit
VFGYPIGLILSNLVGNSLLDNPLSYTFAFNGAAGWLIAVVAIAALAGLFPAWRASRLSVQQTLAYE